METCGEKWCTRGSNICLGGWLAEQHLGTVSSPCFLWKREDSHEDNGASPPHCSHSSIHPFSSLFSNFSLCCPFVWLILIKPGSNSCSDEEISSIDWLCSHSFPFFLFTLLSASFNCSSFHLFTTYPFVLWRTGEEKNDLTLYSKNNRTVTRKRPRKLAELLHMV